MRRNEKENSLKTCLLHVLKYLLIPSILMSRFLIAYVNSATTLTIISELSFVKDILSQIGPMLSALLFILAGIFYAIGQMLPPDKRANFHTTATNIIIGAIVVGALSVASNSLATASTHLLSNITNFTNSIT